MTKEGRVPNAQGRSGDSALPLVIWPWSFLGHWWVIGDLSFTTPLPPSRPILDHPARPHADRDQMLKLILLATGIAILLLLLTRSAEAKDDLPLEKHTYRDAHGKELPYRLLKPLHPEEGKKYPLVIFLHGAGERGSDNEKQLIHGVPHFVAKETQEKYPCFLVAAQCPAGQRWVEVDWSADSHTQPKAPGEAGRLTLELIEQVMKELPIDPKRVYLTGLSMGGYGTWDLLARRPELFAAA